MTAFQETSVCSFSPFLSVLLVTNNVLISFLSFPVLSHFKQAVVSFIVKEELSFSLTFFSNYYFPPFMFPNSINPFSLLHRIFSFFYLNALCKVWLPHGLVH